MDRQIALVTGAGKGIGAAVAQRLAKDGFFVIVNYRSSENAANELISDIKSSGGDACGYRCDVSNEDECVAMFKDIFEKYGNIAVLVNNAGITKDGLLMKMSSEAFDSVINTNLRSAFLCSREASKQMIKEKYGRIINISSVSGIMGNFGQTNYSASKAGIIGLTKASARELCTRNITVNAIAPGFIATDMTSVLSDKIKETVKAGIPMKCIGDTDDIAAAVSFFAAKEAKYITGQVLAVDGGMSM